MALAFKINKKTFDALSDDMKAEYIAGDKDGEFVLDVQGLPEPEDTGPLKRALESEKTKYKTLKAERDDLKSKVDNAPDVEALKTQHEQEVGKYKNFTEKTLIDGEANKLAARISTAPALLAPIIKARLVADLSGDEPVTKVKGPDGKVSDDFTIEKLSSELVANKEYAAIIVGSKASGGGAPKNTSIKPLGGGAPKDGEPPVDLSKLKGAALVEHLKAQKAASQEAQQ